MSNQLQKAINLVKKTGDRLVVFDANNEEAYVVMSLSQYEALNNGKNNFPNLTEEQLLDKINRDIANWKSQRDNESVDNFLPPLHDEAEENMYYYPEQFEASDFKETSSKNFDEKRRGWRIPQEMKKAAETVEQ